MVNIEKFGQIDYQRLKSFKERGFNPTCIFDVGASNGSWSNRISAIFPEASFHLFEPLADLESNYANKLEAILQEHPNWKLHKCAVGKEDEIVKFYRSRNSSYGSTSLKVQQPDRYDIFELPKVSLDKVIEEYDLPKPDLIKADTQGGELDMLKGCEKHLPDVQLLLLETWLSKGYGQSTPLIHEIMGYLLPFGFYLFDLGGCYRDGNNNLISQDFFFVNKNSELAKQYIF